MGINSFTQDDFKRLLTTNKKTGILSDFPVGLLSGPPKPAAILIPIFWNNNTWNVLFIRRTSSLAEHGGQVAFPGGRSEIEDQDLIQTALRETKEEIGLQPADVLVLGQISEFITITNYQVLPFVGLIPWPYAFRRAEAEVARIFSIPLVWLADPRNHEVRQRILPEPYNPISVVYFKPFDNEVLWGVSAGFVLDFVDHLISVE